MEPCTAGDILMSSRCFMTATGGFRDKNTLSFCTMPVLPHKLWIAGSSMPTRRGGLTLPASLYPLTFWSHLSCGIFFSVLCHCWCWWSQKQWVICVFSAKSEGRTCEYNGRIYQNGESFRAGCKHQCTCIDGAVGCAPLCSNKLPPASPSCPYPRLVRIPGQCCFTVDCNKGTWRLPPKHQVCYIEFVRNLWNSLMILEVKNHCGWTC